VGLPYCHELLANFHGEGQVRKPIPMEMAELAPADLELDPAESMRLDGDTRPARNFALNSLRSAHSHVPNPLLIKTRSHCDRCPETSHAANLRYCVFHSYVTAGPPPRSLH